MARLLEAKVREFSAATSPLEQKRRLVERIRAVVRDPLMGPFVPGTAADLVIFHGVPQADLDRILKDVDAMREAGRSARPAHFSIPRPAPLPPNTAGPGRNRQRKERARERPQRDPDRARVRRPRERNPIRLRRDCRHRSTTWWRQSSPPPRSTWSQDGRPRRSWPRDGRPSATTCRTAIATAGSTFTRSRRARSGSVVTQSRSSTRSTATTRRGIPASMARRWSVC